ncbi:hypothetical protein BJ165DRAFT_1533241 [Panaeolus papilionaceus]|nr:hypothetical protein BJ165DRAFT_1533241 [Panaeolus papilionaceus]
MDGNNSLKLVDSTFRAGNEHADACISDSTCWITPEDVNMFKDKVSKKPVPQNATLSAPKNSAPSSHRQPATSDTPPNIPAIPTLSSSRKENSSGNTPAGGPDNADEDVAEDVAWLNVTEIDELAQCVNTCVEWWRNAGPEARKKMFALFAVAGIFLAVCRHGHVLVICDMIHSGELMKYPLAVVNRLFDDYGSDICLGYDIMCAFYKTLSCSSLGKKTAAFHLHGVVPSFHGHTHNRTCQLQWHPMYTEGVGLEDFEECERTFSKSNELASVTRLATPFHRQQHIDKHYRFHDEDKHAASGNFILQNYRQALERIQDSTPKLKALKTALKLKPSDYKKFLQEEQAHLEGLKSEPEEVRIAVDYVDLLVETDKLKKLSDEATSLVTPDAIDHGIVLHGHTQKEMRAAYAKARTALNCYQVKEQELSLYEEEHGERAYRHTLDSLERLVVQRLFELTKLGMNGVGYKMREKIGKALRSRSDAIKTALKNYNEAAAKLVPPRDSLSWSTVLNAIAIADFDFLRDTCTDIRSFPWAKPSYREAMSLFFGIKRAKEEIIRLNVEIIRLLTYMLDCHVDLCQAIQANVDAINQKIIMRLNQVSLLPGFTGKLKFGCRIGRNPKPHEGIPMLQWAEWVNSNSSSTTHTQGDDVVEVPQEVDINTDVVIELLNRISVV